MHSIVNRRTAVPPLDRRAPLLCLFDSLFTHLHKKTLLITHKRRAFGEEGPAHLYPAGAFAPALTAFLWLHFFANGGFYKNPCAMRILPKTKEPTGYKIAVSWLLLPFPVTNCTGVLDRIAFLVFKTMWKSAAPAADFLCAFLYEHRSNLSSRWINAGRWLLKGT